MPSSGSAESAINAILADRISPAFQGRPLEVRYSAGLRDTAGHPAHAATLIRTRLISLDRELKRNRREHARILLHELFHFAWVRLSNRQRLAWEGLLRDEYESRARGEAGWSAEWRKGELTARDIAGRSRRWREYCCESFCDTGAWLQGGVSAELTLARKWQAVRHEWFGREFEGRAIPI